MTSISRIRRSAALAAAALMAAGLVTAEPARPAAAPDPAFTRQIVESTLGQVDALARSLDTLEVFGKSTLEQSATVLDMGPESAPILAQWLRNRRKDWKTRYWAADMLAYVGKPDSIQPLLRCARNEKEAATVRIRALESIEEIWKKYRANTQELRNGLQLALTKTRDPKVRDKIRRTLEEIDI